jgi:hypothetical protein
VTIPPPRLHRRSRRRLPSGLIAIPLLAAACASVAPRPGPAAPAADACEPARDRAAILAMAGEYEVGFSFREELALAEGYTPREPYQVDGHELVVVVEDAPTRIVLQHLLVVGPASEPRVVKHWRQDWVYEDSELLEFRGSGTWEARRLAPDAARCAWTQSVFEVNDAPRYEGWGRWQHTGGTSAWTSNETWRPLPRREYTKRSDYDVVVGFNRHVITPTGWAHEQDNTKVILRGAPRALVREHGVNTYRRTRARDFQVARDYWSRTQAFWQDVREVWKKVVAAGPRLSLRPGVDGTSQHAALFALADDPGALASATAEARRQRVEAIIRESWESGPASPPATAHR